MPNVAPDWLSTFEELDPIRYAIAPIMLRNNAPMYTEKHQC